jgi:hypothetical protein
MSSLWSSGRVTRPARQAIRKSALAAARGPSLESLLALIGGASSAEDLDRALRTARTHYAGSMMEQLERAAAVRAHFLLENLGEAAGG